MVTVLALLGVLGVLFAAAVLSTREQGLLAEAPAGDPDVPLPDEPLTPEDVGRLRFSMAARGYRMSQVDRALERLAQELADRDRRIALLESAAEGHEQPAPVREAAPEDLPVAAAPAPVPAAPPAEPAPSLGSRTPEPAPAYQDAGEATTAPVTERAQEAAAAPPVAAAPVAEPSAAEPPVAPPADAPEPSLGSGTPEPAPAYQNAGEAAAVPPPVGPPAPDAPGEPRLGDEASASSAPAAAGPTTWSSPSAVPEFPVIAAPDDSELPPADLPSALVAEERAEEQDRQQ